MNKSSNKNNLHNSHTVSGANLYVDNDHVAIYRAISSKRGRRRRTRRHLFEEYGVNGKNHLVNGENDALDRFCGWCKGYDSRDI